MGYNIILNDGKTIYIDADDFFIKDDKTIKLINRNKTVAIININNIVGFAKNIYMS